MVELAEKFTGTSGGAAIRALDSEAVERNGDVINLTNLVARLLTVLDPQPADSRRIWLYRSDACASGFHRACFPASGVR